MQTQFSDDDPLILSSRYGLFAIAALQIGCYTGLGDAVDPEFIDADVWYLAETPVYSVSESIGKPAVAIHQVESGYLFNDGSAVISTSSLQLVFV